MAGKFKNFRPALLACHPPPPSPTIQRNQGKDFTIKK